jgi:hypothetical protein
MHENSKSEVKVALSSDPFIAIGRMHGQKRELITEIPLK